MLNIISIYSSNFKNILRNKGFFYMIKVERNYKDINIKLEAVFAGNDLCVLITGGDKPHVGAVSVYSKEEGIKTISLKNHKDYIIGETFINSINDIFNGNISVSSGIHIDNISKQQIDDVYKCCNSIFKKVKMEIFEVTTNFNEVKK